MVSYSDISKGLNVYEKHVADYDKNFRQRNKLPKNYDWRPYRWCSRDIVFSLLVVKHNRQGNYLEVDVCLVTNPPQYIEHSGARVALGFLLSEAYKCGGSMEIVFTGNVEGGRVPGYICDLALDYDIHLKHVFEGHITPYEARQLYLELVGFSQETKARIMKLSVDGELTPERACFVVLGGVWTVAEAEMIILSCDHPERILTSMSRPEDRHLYLNDLLITRSVVLGGALDRKLLKTELTENGQIIESEDDEAPLFIDFDPLYMAKIYRAETDLLIPWLRNAKQVLKTGQSLVVLVRARSDSEIRHYFLNDLKSLKALIHKYHLADLQTMICFLTTRDFEDIPEVQQQQITSLLEQNGVYLMISPDSLSSLNKEAIRRLETGRLIRQ